MKIRVSTSVYPPFIPQTQVQQGPQVKAPIALAAAMLVEHARDETIIQKISLPQRRIDQVLVKPSAQSLPEPLAHRRAETTFRFVKQIVRQDFFQRAFENVLAGRALNLQRTRQAERIFNQVMIEKRHACLDARRHRDLVD